tara:strand:- start:261 stop:509 length:249 start_codon:yes stop_codon:yes gene_type:complete
MFEIWEKKPSPQQTALQRAQHAWTGPIDWISSLLPPSATSPFPKVTEGLPQFGSQYCQYGRLNGHEFVRPDLPGVQILTVLP